MSVIIELKYVKCTDKAYQLPSGSWIPKSILDGRGLKHPYYKIADWWISVQFNNIYNKVGEYNMFSNRNTSESDKKDSLKKLTDIKGLIINNLRDLPDGGYEHWQKYWKSAASDVESTVYSRKNRLNHYNDIGAITDLSFQDLYGC